LPNIFIYSLFFAAWQWSSTHFRAHWHNIITNAYRHSALEKFENIQEKQEGSQSIYGIEDDVKLKNDLKRYEALLLLILTDTAYLESAAGTTSAEKIIKMEEAIRGILTVNKKENK
jgi:hypothetical protein